MGRRDHPYAQVGRPVERVKAKWAVLDRGRMAKFNVGLIQRTRTSASIVEADVSYAVVRSKEPILANGTKLRSMEAVPFKANGFRRHHPLRALGAEVWHASLAVADAKFRYLVGRTK